MRLMIFETHPVQYHAPVYRELHRLCEETRCGSIRVVYASDISVRSHRDGGFQKEICWDEPLLEGYPSTILQTERGTPFQGFRSLGGRGVVNEIQRWQPDAVMLTGLTYAFDWAAYWGALRNHVPIWIRTETQDKAFARSYWKQWIRSILYRLSYLPVRRAFAIGKLNAAHYSQHGISEPRQRFSRYCVVDRFHHTPKERGELRDSVRHAAGFKPGTTVLLFVGKLQPKKYPDLILDALSQLSPRERQHYGILWVGSGELEGTLRARTQNLSEVKVHFAGFRNQSELAPFYYAADFLVLPSRQMGETWGLVVNEALMAGLRVILSSHVGCHADFSELSSVSLFDGTPEGFVRTLRSAPGPESTEENRAFMKRYSVEAAAWGIALEMSAMNVSRGSVVTPQDSLPATPRVQEVGSTH